MKWSAKHTVLAGLALITGVNAIALGGVAYNRSGEAESTLRLGERELHVPYRWSGSKENSGLELQIDWRVLPPAPEEPSLSYDYAYRSTTEWMDEKKLAMLGFDTATLLARDLEKIGDRHLQSKEVLLVLELNGPAYREAIERARKRGDKVSDGLTDLQREERIRTRLFVVDAGLDQLALRQKYLDRRQYAIVRGQVQPFTLEIKGVRRVWASITALSVSSVNVPLEMRSAFPDESRTYENDAQKVGKYEADISFGKRLEPWIASAKRVSPR